MPATGFEIDHDTLALLGRLPEALRAAERELANLERDLARAAQQGKNLDGNKLGRANELKLSSDRYRSIVQDEKKIKEVANEEVQKLLAKHGGSSASKTPPSSAPNRIAPPAPRGIQTVARLLNTHNPHGAVRNVMSGNVSESLINRLVPSSRAGGLAASGFVAGKATQMVFDHLQKKADQSGSAARTDLQTNSSTFDLARSMRFSSGENKLLTDVRAAAYDASKSKTAGGVMGWLADKGIIGKGLAEGMSGDSSLAALRKSFAAKNELFKNDFKNVKTGTYAEEIAKAMASPEVQGKFSVKARGLKQYAYDQSVGMANGETQQAMEREAILLAAKRQAAEYEKRQKAAAEFYASASGVTATVVRVDSENRLNAFQQMQFEKFTDWNQY